jgi:ankyrin
MSRNNLTILALCLLILGGIAVVYFESRQYQQQTVQSSMGADPLFDAVHGKQYDLVEQLVNKSPGILKRKHFQGGTYMNCAASMKDIKMIKLLLKLGGSPNGAAGCGMAPLILATGGGDLATVKVLLDAGADPNIFGHASSPLANAKNSKNTKMVNLLLKYGAKEMTSPPKGPAAPKEQH